MKWGVSCQRWGRHYDHGLVTCGWHCRVVSKGQRERHVDYASLERDEGVRERFDASVARHLADSPCDVDSASASLSRLTKCVTDAARETLPVKRSQRVRKREVSQRTKLLFEERRRNFGKMNDRERHVATRAITVSSRDDFRHYVHSVLDDMEAAESVGNLRTVTKLTRILAHKDCRTSCNPSKGADGRRITTTTQLLGEWEKFLGTKFKRPAADADRNLESAAAEEDELGYDELRDCLKALRSGKATGWDDVPVEAYRGSVHATSELFRICRMMWHTERIPPELVRGIFIMLHKKGPRDDMANYRAICLLSHSYKLLSAVVARRLMAVLEGHLPDTQAGFRPARGCRDNVCALRWFINMVLHEGRRAVVTFIDYSAAFDTESQIFLDSALAEAGVSVKVRRIVQAIFASATGVVRIRQPGGGILLSEPFNIERGVLQGDIFSPVCFIAGLDRIFRLHDHVNAGMTVGTGANTVYMSKCEYADDAALIDENAGQAAARVTSLATGSLEDAAMMISAKKSKVMHIHKMTRTSVTTEADVAELNLLHKCDSCSREFTKLRGLRIHMARWCDGGRTQRSRLGSLTDKAVKMAKRRAAEASLDRVALDNTVLENVLTFEYLGSRLQCDGDDGADVSHRMEIAQSAFGSLSHLWADHRLSRATKLRLYRLSVCSSLTHCCEAWTLTRTVTRMVNGFNSRCLHVITGEEYRVTATEPAYNLVLAVRKRRLRYLGHVLRMPADRMVRRSLMALVKGGAHYPAGSLLSDCVGEELRTLEAMAANRNVWRAKVASLN